MLKGVRVRVNRVLPRCIAAEPGQAQAFSSLVGQVVPFERSLVNRTPLCVGVNPSSTSVNGSWTAIDFTIEC